MERIVDFESSVTRPRLAGTLRAGTVTWFSIGGLWTAMMLVHSVSGTPAEKSAWGMVLVLSALWLAAVSVDWVQQLGVVSGGVAEVVRAGLLGGAMLVSPVAVANPEAVLPYWVTALLTVLSSVVVAPLLVDARRRYAAHRLLADVRAAVATAGMTLFVVVVVAAGLGPLGFELSSDTFVTLVAASTFCVLPTVFTRLRNANLHAVHA